MSDQSLLTPTLHFSSPVVTMPHTEAKLTQASEQQQDFQKSAGVLMRSLADTVVEWRQQLPEDQQPAILAILHGGVQIQVERLSQESYHGIRIEGTMNGNPCMVLSHQSTVQLLCFVQKIEKEEFRRRIGFIIDGEEQEV